MVLSLVAILVQAIIVSCLCKERINGTDRMAKWLQWTAVLVHGRLSKAQHGKGCPRTTTERMTQLSLV